MGHNPLSVHARARNILTGDPIVGSGALRHGRILWPTRDPEGNPPAGGATPPAGTPPEGTPPAGTPPEGTPPAGAGADGKTDEQRGYPLNTALADMSIEQKFAYATAQSRKHEAAFQKLAGKDMTPEKIAQIIKAQEDAADAAKTELERAVDAARKEGRESALAESSSSTVKALIAAHAVAAKLDPTKDADVLESFETLNPSSFIADDNTIDAAKLSKVLNRLAPVGGGTTGTPPWPATGQGRQNSGTGSAKDAGHAEAVRRGYRTADTAT